MTKNEKSYQVSVNLKFFFNALLSLRFFPTPGKDFPLQKNLPSFSQKTSLISACNIN